jgi:hypothetical protein
MEDGRRVVRRARSRKDAAAKLELLLKARAEGQAMVAGPAARRGGKPVARVWRALTL